MVNDAGEGVSTRVNAMGDDDSGPNPSELVGRSIAGKFVVEALIATGGAGAVYRARQLALDRVVALKVLRQDIARDRYFVERFKREARAASRLDHPNSVPVFDFGHIDESLLYLAMEYVEGKTLHNVIADEWPLGDTRVVDLMSQVLSAVAVAHDMEVIHRDLKPDNIMILPATSDDGEATELAKVCDFGIATLGAVQPDGGGGQLLVPASGEDTFEKHGAYLEVERSMTETVTLLARADGLYRAGNLPAASPSRRVPPCSATPPAERSRSRPGSASRRPASCGRSRTTSPCTRIWISRSTSGWSERFDQWRGR